MICCIEVGIIFLFSDFWTSYLKFSNTIILLIGVTAFSHYIVNFAQTAFIYEKKAISNFILTISVSVCSVGLSIFFIMKSSYSTKYLGRIYGVVIVYFIVAIISWIYLFLQKPTIVKKEYLKYGIIVGTPIVFHALSQQILGQSDRIMMQAFGVATSEVGIYSLFYTLSSVLSTLLNALNNSWCPFYYDDLNEKKTKIIENKCKNYVELFTIISIGFLLLSREVSYFMADESFWKGIEVIPILVWAIYFTFMYQFPVNYEFFYRKTKIIAAGTVGSGVLNIILNTILIPLMGMYGAAIATAISYLALFLVHYYIVTHMKKNPYDLKIRMFIPGIIGILLGSIAFYILKPWGIIRWTIGIVLGVFEMYRVIKRKSIF